MRCRDFVSSLVVKTPPSRAGAMGSIPVRSHMLRNVAQIEKKWDSKFVVLVHLCSSSVLSYLNEHKIASSFTFCMRYSNFWHAFICMHFTSPKNLFLFLVQFVFFLEIIVLLTFFMNSFLRTCKEKDVYHSLINQYILN